MDKELEATLPINRAHFGNSDKIFQYLAAISVCFAAVSAGTVLAWSSPALTELAPLNTTNGTDIPIELEKNITIIEEERPKIILTKEDEALIGSIVNLGALIYAVPTGYIADKFGRKIAIYSSGASFLLGWLFIIAANNVTMLLIGRFFGGMGLGAICVVSPMYIGEIAENSIRGTLTSFFQIFLSVGILLTFVIGSFVNYVTMSIILTIFPLLLFTTFPFMPESHAHLLKIGKAKEAEQSLIRFRGNNRDYNIQGELQVIRDEINKSSNKDGKFSDIITVKANRKAAVAVLGLLGFQQLCGINAITFYAQQIFAAAGSNIEPSNAAIIMSVLQCVGGYLAMSVVERAGRKYFLILSSVGMMMGLCGLGMFFHLQKLNIGTSTFGFLPIACVVMYIVAFTLGYGCVPFMLMHELFSPEVRGIGSGIAIVIAWTSSFLVTYAFPISVVVLGNYSTFYILCAINAAAAIFVMIFVPETRGKTLLAIQDMLNS